MASCGRDPASIIASACCVRWRLYGMGLEGQLRKFAASALNLGLSREEIIEAVIQTAPYGGFPRALNGLGILSEALTTAR